VTRMKRTKPSLALPLSWSAFGLTSSSPSARLRHRPRRVPVKASRSYSPGSQILLVSAFVTSLARPGGNLTGVSVQTRELAAKRLELLVTAVQKIKRVGVLWDPRLPSSRPEVTELEGAARFLHVELFPAQVSRADELEPTIRAIAEQRAGALLMVPGP